MSVLKSKQKASKFEVFHHFYKTRKEITNLLLRDFGYDFVRAEKRIEKIFGGKPYETLNDDEKYRYNNLKKKNEAFDNWFISDERQVIVDCIRSITENIFVANSIYPMYLEELVERRIYQDRAIGQCYRLTQELQYAIETLPVDIEKYVRFSDLIQTEINLIKGWRKSDNKFKGVISDSASNFANVNNNGNANNNDASASPGVRPDFNSVIK